MSIIFVGHFASSSRTIDVADSSAGNQVQKKILAEIMGQAHGPVFCFSMRPAASWPRGRFVVPSEINENVCSLGYVNFPIIKHIIFSIKLALKIIKLKPRYVFQYNSYLFENMTLIFFRYINDFRLCVFIQDVHAKIGISQGIRKSLRAVAERLSLRLLNFSDLIVPVSHKILIDFGLTRPKKMIFQGGLTDLSERLMEEHPRELFRYAVFAGGLEPHNGIEQLAREWTGQGLEFELHIFGDGSLRDEIREIAAANNRIVYHGKKSEDEVFSWQRSASWNFCLRYSCGINQEYFFPSKFFNIMASPGRVVVNDFFGLPIYFRNHILVLDDDFNNLRSLVVNSSEFPIENIAERRSQLRQQASWEACLARCFKLLE